MQAWVVGETEEADFGDSRLNQRYEIILESLGGRPNLSIPAASGGWNETLATYRFFDNKKVGPDTILKPHMDATIQRIRNEEVCLLVQDTTEIETTRPDQQIRGSGPLNEETRLGFYNHPMLSVTPERIPLGIVWTRIWARDMDAFLKTRFDRKAKEKARKQKPIEEKESYRWLLGYKQACKISAQTPQTRLIVISDSEGDVFECYNEWETTKDDRRADWLVRACQDRSLVDKDTNGQYEKLWSEITKKNVIGNIDVKVRKNTPVSKDDRKRRQPRSARIATMEIRAGSVTLKSPFRKGKKMSNVQVNTVLVREANPPDDEDPVEWLLVTSLSVENIEDVFKVIDYYCCRWQIEIYFRVLKSGCRVEDRQFETKERFTACMALYMVVAWRVMYTLMIGRNCPEIPCDLVFDSDEWMSVWSVVRKEIPPEHPPSLGEMIAMVAGLGGYLGRTHDGPPGPKTMWIGMQRMMDLALAWQAFGPSARGADPVEG